MRQDVPGREPGSISDQMRLAKLIPYLMALGKAASKSNNRFEEATIDIRKLKEKYKAIPANIEDHTNSMENSMQIPASSNAPTVHIHMKQLPVATTKGRYKKSKKTSSDTAESRPTSTYKRKKPLKKGQK